MPGKALVLVDTCVLMLDPDVLNRVHGNNGFPVLTSTVLDELDYNKKGDEDINRNARAILREFSKNEAQRLTSFPDGKPLIGDDVLTTRHFREGVVYLLARKHFSTNSNNDAKIIELASDYNFILISRDHGMCVRAQTLGVEAYFWQGPNGRTPKGQRSGPNQRQQRQVPDQGSDVSIGIKPFAVARAIVKDEDVSIVIDRLPATGDMVYSTSGAVLRLGDLISAGGEGTIYETPAEKVVCKIYHKSHLTERRRKKIELMVSRKICFKGICWPIEIVQDVNGVFVGYTMPRATGKTMQTSMFVKPVLEKNFPNWNRRDLVNLCIEFIEQVTYLHRLNVLMGDINPLNLLVNKNSQEVWIVDTDSFQIEAYPCPVSTVNFTPPENQGKNHEEFLRTIDNELFAVATMLFMILLPGKPPYSQQGGATPGENIKNRNFPYWFRDGDDVFSGENAPKGSWQFIWANMDWSIRQGFHQTFREGKRIPVDDWLSRLKRYRDALDNGRSSIDIFPLSSPVRDPIQATCSGCSKSFTASKTFVDKLTVEGKPVWCPQCKAKNSIKWLARDSLRSANGGRFPPRQNAGQPQPNPLYQSMFPDSFSSNRSLRSPRSGTRSGNRNSYNPNSYNPNSYNPSSYKPSPPPSSSGDGLIMRFLKNLFN